MNPFDFTRHLSDLRDPGLPPSMLRDNTASRAASLAAPAPMTDDDIRENINAAPWAKRFTANFIEPGLVRYQGKNGQEDEWILLKPEAVARIARSLIGKPIIDWDHADVWPEIIGDGQADGVVYDVWKGDDGWWHAGYVVWTKSAIEHCESGDWSVSCAYTETETDFSGGKHHSIPYTQEVIDGVCNHLALVKKPRYEGARIRANSTENGGYKMAWKLSDLIPGKKPAAKPEVLRLNADEAAKTKMDVDGEAHSIADLVKRHNDAMAPSDILTCSDDDEVEFEGKKYKAGDLRAAHRNAMKKNAEDKAKEEAAAKAARENAAKTRANDGQLKGAGAEDTGKLAGAGADKTTGVEDNPDKGVEAAKELSALKERLNSMAQELATIKAQPAKDLRAAAHMRFAPAGGEPEDLGPVTVEDRIRRGAADFSLHSHAHAGADVE